jgi:hypothetical protein
LKSPTSLSLLVAVLLGCSACTGGAGGALPGGSLPQFDLTFAVHARDVNGDGATDVIAARARIAGPPPHPGFAVVVPADPASPGSFATGTAYPIGTDPLQVVAADLDGDAAPDLVAACSTAATIEVKLQDGAQPGVFQAPAVHAVGSFPRDVAVGDLDDDGLADVAFVSDQLGFSVMFQDPAGNAQLGAPIPVGPAIDVGSVIVADLDGDGLQDLVGTSATAGRVLVLLQDETQPGSFLPAGRFPVGFQPVAVTAGDLDLDGTLDLAVANYGTPTSGSSASASLLLGDPAALGSFEPQLQLETEARAQGVALGDLDDDGWPDLAVACSGEFPTRGGVALHLQQSSAPGTFRPVSILEVSSFPSSIDIGDLDGDGLLDLLVGDGGVWVLLQDAASPGTFLDASQLFE